MVSLLAAVLATAWTPIDDGSTPYFRISVVDDQTGRGVPLVELRTVNNIRCYTDSRGVVAFHEPGLMDRKIFFYVWSHGYEYPKDGFGFRGTALDVAPGGSATLKIHRLNIAERLYRVTGAGICRDSVLLGDPVPISRPVLGAQVVGQDSVVNAVFDGRLYWFWGDTARPSYPLGNFHAAGATSLLPGAGGLDPSQGVELTYFVDDQGFAKQMAPVPGEGPTWIDGLVALSDDDGKQRLFAAYAKVRANMEAYERGLLEFDREGAQFRPIATFDLSAPVHPGGHCFLHGEGGVRYVYFARPYPLTRVPARPKSLKGLSAYEAFTCLKPGSRLDKPEIDRAADGTLRYAWKKNTPPVGPAEQAKLIEAGLLKPDEALLQLRDVETGKPVTAHGGSVYWNEYRRRWVMIAVEAGGISFLGEVWYAEADAPVGPWVYAVKIVTHERYSFYNPKQHPMFDADGGRTIYFEGTYSAMFSGNDHPTPRYDYNQIMYKLDLSDPRVMLPVPVYEASGEDGNVRFETRGDGVADEHESARIAFYAPDRPRPGTVPVRAWQRASGGIVLIVGDAEPPSQARDPRTVFYAMPPGAPNPPATTSPLFELTHPRDGRHAYVTDVPTSRDARQDRARPICRVWCNPARARPVSR